MPLRSAIQIRCPPTTMKRNAKQMKLITNDDAIESISASKKFLRPEDSAMIETRHG